MSGLVAPRICPLALMKSNDRNPYQIGELQAHVSQQVVLIFGGDRVVHRKTSQRLNFYVAPYPKVLTTDIADRRRKYRFRPKQSGSCVG